MPFCFSPSNIMNFIQCPRKFAGTSIWKTIKYKPTKQKSRGMMLHEQIQDAMREMDKFDVIRKDTTLDAQYTYGAVQGVHDLRRMGYQLLIEHELCMTKQGQMVGWWDDKAFMRAKADAFLLHHDPNMYVQIIDIKTGKNHDKQNIQLRIEALMAHIIYQRQLVQYQYWYIDQGETEYGMIDFSKGLAPVMDLYDTMQEMQQSIKNNDFPATKNSLCRWCDFYRTENCDA